LPQVAASREGRRASTESGSGSATTGEGTSATAAAATATAMTLIHFELEGPDDPAWARDRNEEVSTLPNQECLPWVPGSTPTVRQIFQGSLQADSGRNPTPCEAEEGEGMGTTEDPTTRTTILVVSRTVGGQGRGGAPGGVGPDPPVGRRGEEDEVAGSTPTWGRPTTIPGQHICLVECRVGLEDEGAGDGEGSVAYSHRQPDTHL
jgi:hypothetical protein